MSRERQIEEIAREMCHLSAECKTCQICNERYHGGDDLCYFQCVAKEIINHGYRKQSEGEWIAKTDYAGYGYYCSNCNAVFTGENAEWIAKEHIYCPKCGAHMRGGKNE